MKKAIRLVAFVASAAVLSLGYQNCSSPSAEFSGSTTQTVAGPPTSSYNGGNGGGYDGKPYVQPDLARICTDGDAAKSRIVELGGVYRLVRLDCANLASPQVVTVTARATSVNGNDSIVYDDRVFDSQDRLVSGTQLPTKGYCTEVTSAADITVPQTVGTDFDVALVIAVSGTDLVASMIFDDNSTSDAYQTSVVRIGANPGVAGRLSGRYSYQSGTQLLQFDFVNGEAVTLANQLPVVDSDTPSVTGTLVDFDSTLTRCTWN